MRLETLLRAVLVVAGIVTLFLDGKTFADSTMVVALGVTLDGAERFFVETDTESEKVLRSFWRSLLEREKNGSRSTLTGERAMHKRSISLLLFCISFCTTFLAQTVNPTTTSRSTATHSLRHPSQSTR